MRDDSETQVHVKVLEPVSRALFAVSDLVKSCRVVFDEEFGDSYLHHRRTGEKTNIDPRRGVYIIQVCSKDPGVSGA